MEETALFDVSRHYFVRHGVSVDNDTTVRALPIPRGG